uniref:Glycosyltransferase 61 catalytic domain-containing protein n=1 Tax=Aegilops tauschii TaxID=37682 RepID=M8BBG9_AEGTA
MALLPPLPPERNIQHSPKKMNQSIMEHTFAASPLPTPSLGPVTHLSTLYGNKERAVRAESQTEPSGATRRGEQSKGQEGGKGAAREGGGGGRPRGSPPHHDTARLLKAFTRTVEPRNFGIGLLAGFLLVTCAYFSTASYCLLPPLKAFTRTVEPRNFGIGLLAGFLLVTCAYFSTARFDAIHIAPLDLGVPGQDAALSREGSKAEVLDTDGDDKDLVHDASLADTKKDDTFARDGDAAVEAAKDDDAGGGALLPPLSANGTQEEQGVLEDQELLVQDAIAAAANSPNKSSSSSNGGSQPVVQSDPATLPAPVQQTPPSIPVPEAPKQEEAKAPPAQQIALVPEPVKQQPDQRVFDAWNYYEGSEEIVRAAQKVGFEVVVSEGTHEVAPFAELANTCDAMLGVHGAGLTNMVFLPTGGVVIQVVPLGGLEFVAGYFRTPSRDMGLRYLEYRIAPAESTLTEQYPSDHPIFTDPDGVKSKGWDSLKQVYLDKQDVRLDLKRFRPLLKKAIAHIRANKLQ